MSLEQAVQLIRHLAADGRLQEAEAMLVKLLQVTPHWLQGHFFLGRIRQLAGRLDEAESAFREALRRDPGFMPALGELGDLLGRAGKLEEAVGCYQQILARDPACVPAHHKLALAYFDLGRWRESEEAFLAVLERTPHDPICHYNLGNLYRAQVRLEDAIAHYREAIRLKPDHAAAHSNLLFTLNYDPWIAPEDLFEAYQRFQEACETPILARSARPPGLWDGDRRLRVGYLSPDFYTHPVGYGIQPVLAHHDHGQVEVFAYALSAREDALTEVLRGHCDHWRQVAHLDDQAVADRIRDDQLDVLVELSGHSAYQRMLILAHRPAPVQVSWMGLGYTSGMRSVDYFVADPYLVPPEAEGLFSEKIFRLPETFYVYRPQAGAPEVGPLPALADGQVTFGCFSRPIRLNERVIALWAALLQEVPASRLVLNSRSFSVEDQQAVFWEKFARHGIPRERIGFHVTLSHAETMASYRAIDLALDPFPHNAGVTTLEALWMGVPVVTLMDRPSVGRIGASLLTNAGLSDWVARSPEDYVRIAKDWCGRLEELAALRAVLRQKVAASPLCDEERFTRHLEAAYREMVRRSVGADC